MSSMFVSKYYVILSHSLVCEVKKNFNWNVPIEMYQLKCTDWNKIHQIDLIQIFATFNYANYGITKANSQEIML